MGTRTNRTLHALASTELTLFCLGLMMIVVLAGTLAQVHMGTYAAQKEFFDSVVVFARLGDWKIPVLPGGLTVGALWFINLLAAFLVRFRVAKIGLFISHAGLMLLLLGQFFTQTLTRESQLPIRVGETKSYSEDFRDTEMVLIRTVDDGTDEIISIPQSIFSKRRAIVLPGTPITLNIRAYYPNAFLGMAQEGQASIATQGMGPQITLQNMPPVTTDDDANQVSAYVEILSAGQSQGIWLLSSGLGAPQTATLNGQEYRVSIRARRHYLPFSLTLKEFRHDKYMGTEIAKNYASLVHLKDTAHSVDRDTLIYMNHPLRYSGRTFYQASFGEGDQLSVLQVVQNPVWLAPYIACSVMILGLAIHFLRKRYV